MILVSEFDPSATAWRYMTFEKFTSLIQREALWFSKLQIFEDQEEGLIPGPARAALKAQHRDMEDWFPDEERKRQARRFVEDNESNGRELIVASCWFIGERRRRTGQQFDDSHSELAGRRSAQPRAFISAYCLRALPSGQER